MLVVEGVLGSPNRRFLAYEIGDNCRRSSSFDSNRKCKDLSSIGDTVVISVTKEGVKFSTVGQDLSLRIYQFDWE
ncbi:unnamed protein product [Arabidopsis lyrata]|nr:unnamed protein product [Arabidopsis lyrata]